MNHTTATYYDDGYDERNKDGNDNNNAASGLGSDGSIFDPITVDGN